MEEIAEELNAANLKTDKKPSGRWHSTMIKYILSNEKYIGDSLVQKKFTPDELPLRQKRNNGEISQYYIQNSHPAIISKEIYEAVQELLQQRIEQHAPKQKMQKSPLSNIMQCGLCGSAFHKHKSNGEICWFCYQHRKGKTLCPMGILCEKEVYMAFLSIHNKLLDNKDFILKAMLNQLLELQTKVISTNADIVEINEKISELVTQNHSLARLQTKGCIDSAIFIERSNRNNQKIEELRRELRQRQEPDGISNAIEGTQLLLDLLESAKPMLKFEPAIFQSMVKQITVYQETFCFQLANGMILEERRTQS